MSDVLRGCNEDATRMLATFRPSRHVKMVWRVADMSATSRACRARGLWRTTRQTDKRATLPQQTADCYRYEEVFIILVSCYEYATRKLRGNCSRRI